LPQAAAAHDRAGWVGLFTADGRISNTTGPSGTKDIGHSRRGRRLRGKIGSTMLDKPFGRRSLLRGAGALTAASLAPWPVGCAPDDDALTFFFAANPDERDARMRIVDEFQRRHPDIKVRAVLSAPGVMQQLSTFCAGGKCPDVLMAWELTYAELAARGVLLDLNTMLARDQAFAAELQSDGISALYDIFTFNGGQYALPEQWSGNYLFYNKRLFAEAGVPAPPRTWERPWSFTDFLNTATALTKRGGSGRATQWGFVNMWFSYYSAGLFAMNNGVPWATPLKNPTHFNFDNDAFIEAVQFYADLANKYRVAPNASEVQSMSTPDLFAAGKAAIAMGGHWRYQTFIRADGLDFDVTSLQVGPRRQGHSARSNIGSTGLAISTSSRRKEQAWEFVKFATGPVGQALTAESSLFVPVLRSALNSTGFAEAHQRVGNLAVLTQGPAHSEGLPVTPAWEKIVALMDRNFGPVLRGSRPATSLTGLTPALDEVLRTS
jgi:ABC-type glycerol-3-phosphate transport system substrate-binding protein